MAADVVEEADGDEVGDHAGAAVADQWERQAGNRHHPQHHAHIDQHLDGEHRRDADGNEAAKGVGIEPCQLDRAGDQQNIEQQHRGAADNPELMGDDGEDQVIIRFRQPQVLLILKIGPFSKSVAGYPAGSDRPLGMKQLIPLVLPPGPKFIRVANEDFGEFFVVSGRVHDFFVLQEHRGDSHPLIRPHELPHDRANRQPQTEDDCQMLNLGPGDEQHRKQNGHQQHRRPQIRLQQDQYHRQQRQRERPNKPPKLAIIGPKPQIPRQRQDIRDFAEL